LFSIIVITLRQIRNSKLPKQIEDDDSAK